MRIPWAWTLYFISRVTAHSEELDEPLKYFEYFEPEIQFLPSHEVKRAEELDVPDTFHYQSRSRLKVSAFNTTFHLLLNPNHQLIHPSASTSYQNNDAELLSSPLKRSDYLVYNGPVLDETFSQEHHELDWVGLEFDNSRETGWASFMVLPPKNPGSKPSFRGTFSYKGEVYNIQPASNFLRLRSKQDPTIPKYNSHNSVIYRRSDYFQASKKMGAYDSKASCGVSHLHTTNTHFRKKNVVGEVYNKIVRRGSDSVCSSKKKILYMGVAADCSYVSKFGSADEARIQIISDWNMVSGLYEKEFNIKLGIIKIETPSSECPSSIDPAIPWNQKCSTNYSMTSQLDDFSVWRAKKGSDHTGLWHLVSDCRTGTQVGLAWEETICQTSAINSNQPDRPNRKASGTGVSALTKDSWKVIAHEIGHNFGAKHDCVGNCSMAGDQCCPCGNGCDCFGKFIMNPESSLNGGSTFSDCSRKAICKTINTYGTCITSSEQIPTYSFAMCGNGIREKGEDCDCGGKVGCEENPCCDYKTCKYKKGAVCDDKNDSCCKNCQPKPANTVCRPKTGECDVEERCDGKTGFCPKDIVIPNGTPCSNSSSNLKCGNGVCTSRDNQCKLRTAGTSFATNEACKNSYELCGFTCSTSNLYSCLRLSGNFADGTECGRNAYCNQGECEGGTWLDKILTWADNNKYFAIGIIVIISFFTISCISSCICTGTRRLKQRQTQLVSPNHVPLSNFPPQTIHYQRQEFVDPTRFNGTT